MDIFHHISEKESSLYIHSVDRECGSSHCERTMRTLLLHLIYECSESLKVSKEEINSTFTM